MKIEYPIGLLKEIEDLQGVYALNGFPSKKTELIGMHLYRYTDIEKFKNDAKEKKNVKGKVNELVFVSPVKWGDKFERRFLYTKYNNFSQKEIRCMCFTKECFWNEEAGWKSHGFSEHSWDSCGQKDCLILKERKQVRLKLALWGLLSSLSKYAVENGVKIYIGEAIYGLTVKQILNLHNNGEDYHDLFFPNPMRDENFLSLMLLKRKAFLYEDEVRIFIYLNEPIDRDGSRVVNVRDISDEFFLERVKVNYKDFLKEIRLSPFFDDDSAMQAKSDLNKLFSSKIIVKRSDLYANEKDVILDHV